MHGSRNRRLSGTAARGTEYRVFSVQTPFQVIQVAQDLAVRRRMAGRLALRTVLPVALLMPLRNNFV